LSSDARLEETLRAIGFRTTRIAAADLAKYGSAASKPAVIVVDVRGQALPSSVASFRKQHPGTGIVLVASTLDPRLMLEAMRAGVNECLDEPITPDALKEAVRRVRVDSAPEATGRLFAFVGAKGGAGTTTVAVNTATTLARRTGRDVLLIDLHVGYGDAAIFLGVEPRFSVVDALENVHRVDEAYFRGLVERAKAGVDVLASPDRLPQTPIDARRVQALLDFAVRSYDYTVLDVPRSDLAMLDGLEAATAIVLVTTQEVSALRNGGRLAQSLRARYGGARVRTVVNRFDRRAEIAHADIERVMGDSVKHFIPSDYRAAVDASNAGRPVALGDGRLAEALGAIASDLGDLITDTRARPAGMLGRLAFRKA
jgi:pilus assembly protein CpaE